MINTQQLDACVLKFQNQEKEIDKLLDELQTDQALLMDVLVGSHAELLTEEELDYLLFLFLVLYGTFKQQISLPVFSEDEVIKAEEFSWKYINEQNDYDKLVEIFYAEIPNQDVMEFIDLSIAPDDENEIKITPPGRLIMLAVLTALSHLMLNLKT
ncbi:MAG: hypothetical protein IPM92_15120 [Saprospiraceae bacterium]|nr:hypothetical protein [Saprospiraceae bacterium]